LRIENRCKKKIEICHEEKRTENFIVCVFAHVNYRNKIIKVTVGVLKGFFGFLNEKIG
jgi:hypothetical protein